MTVSASIGPISGIDYGSLITGLTELQQAQINSVGTQINTLQQQDTAILGLSALLTGLKVSSASFTSPAVFSAATATSANPSVINATAGIGTAVGNYNFNVQQLASASQQVTQGFSSSTSALGLSGSLTLQLGGGALGDVTDLSELNGGTGVARGSIRITDGSGASTLVDLSHAVSVDDVVNAINSTTGVDVTASISDDHLVLTDNSGGAGKLTVNNAGGTTTASDLGLTGNSSGGVLTGSSLTALTAATSLNSLNDGNGVRTVGVLKDFSVAGSLGSADVSLNGAATVGDAVTDINSVSTASGVTAAISADGTGITLTDAGSGPITVAAENGSLAAYDLGILGNSTAGTFTGSRVTDALSGPLLTDLNGGNQGQSGTTLPQTGTIVINGQSVDLSGASSLNDVINGINSSGTGVTAALDDSGTGITLSSNASSFTVADGTGNLASFLHINGSSTATAGGSQINSGNLHLRYISNNTALSTLNGGTGVSAGKITISGPQLVGSGNTTLTLDLTSATTIGDVINRINTAGLAITARVNNTGDGILLTQTAGTAPATISDVSGGTTAEDLGIAGTFNNNQLNGSFQKTVTVSSTDTLSDIAKNINDLNIGLQASIINDGSSTAPYRLSIASTNSGVAGRVLFDGSGAGLSTTTLVAGQNAEIVYGGNSNGTGGLLSTSSTNTISTLVPGLTLNLTGVGSTSVAVTNDTSQITTAVQNFVSSYNQVVQNIAQVTNFNANDTTQNGVLFGNSNVQQVQDALYSFVTQSYTGSGQYSTLASVGITINQDGTLTLDTDTLNQALTTDPNDIRTLFTTNVAAVAPDFTKNPPVLGNPAKFGIGQTLSNLLDQFTDAQTGTLFDASSALETQEQQLEDQQNSLTILLNQKKNQLTEQFANLEVTIAQLQSQGNALSNFKPVSVSSASTSSSSSS